MEAEKASLPFEAMWRQVVAPIAVLDLQGRHVDVNPAMCRLLGYDRESLLELVPADVIHPDDEPVGQANVEELLAGRADSFPLEVRLLRSDGNIVWVLVQTSLVKDTDGNPELIVSQFHDITAYRELQVLWRQVVSNAPIGMALLNLDGHWTEVNDTLGELVGYSRDELLTMRCGDLVEADDERKQEAVLADLRLGRGTAGTVEVRFRHRDGDPFWMSVRLSVVPGADDLPAYLVGQYEGMGSDVRVSEQRLEELTRMALHDPLTGLANRALLIDRFEQELAELAEGEGALAVLVLDLDQFKQVNDQHGHGIGDQFLAIAAQELVSAVRARDTVARLGGDEFVVLARMADTAEAEALRARVAQRLNTDITLAGRSLRMSASIGLATTRNPRASPHHLIRRADRAMYRLKRSEEHRDDRQR